MKAYVSCATGVIYEIPQSKRADALTFPLTAADASVALLQLTNVRGSGKEKEGTDIVEAMIVMKKLEGCTSEPSITLLKKELYLLCTDA